MKALAVGLVVASAVAIAVYSRRAANTGARTGQPTMLIALETGETYSVHYVYEGGIVFAVTDGPWWEHLTGDGDGVTVVLDGETTFARVRAVEEDEAIRATMLARLRPDGPSSRDVVIEVKLAPWAIRKRGP